MASLSNRRSYSGSSVSSHPSLHQTVQDLDETSALLPSYSDVERKQKQERGSECISTRHVLALMAFLGFVNVYALRVNLSVALVAMVNSTSKNDNSSKSDECPDANGGNSTSSASTGEFNWDQQTQGYVLGAFFYGYIITQLPGGWMASKIGGKNLFGFGVLCTAVLTLITPFAARFSVYLFIAVRVLEGIGEGVTFPAMHAMWGNWAPVWERSKLVSFSYAGAQLGTVISLPISGLLCDSDIAGGWPSVFYIFGAVGCLWFVAWMLVTHNTPADHPRISAAERDYIESSIGKKEKVRTPWKQIFTSSALWGLAVAHVCNNWGFYTLLTCLPTYMKNILKFDMKENGLLSALPYLACWVVMNITGFLADYIRGHGYVSTGNTRKIFNTLGILCGITNGLATIPGFVAPAVVGYLTNNNETRDQWQKIFYIAAGIYAVGAITFCIFAKGEEMPWSREPPKDIIVSVDDPVTRVRYDSQGSRHSINEDPPPAYTEEDLLGSTSR